MNTSRRKLILSFSIFLGAMALAATGVLAYVFTPEIAVFLDGAGGQTRVLTRFNL
jgi:hypothetical protein